MYKCNAQCYRGRRCRSYGCPVPCKIYPGAKFPRQSVRSGKVSFRQLAKIVGTVDVDDFPQEGFSTASSSDGSTIAIGGPSANSNVGAVWIFIRSGSNWLQQAKLVGTGVSGFSFQGVSVALSGNGNTLAVGGSADALFIGAVWIFTRTGSSWTQQGPKLIGLGAVGNANQGPAYR
jgi:hypothetical protein